VSASIRALSRTVTRVSIAATASAIANFRLPPGASAYTRVSDSASSTAPAPASIFALPDTVTVELPTAMPTASGTTTFSMPFVASMSILSSLAARIEPPATSCPRTSTTALPIFKINGSKSIGTMSGIGIKPLSSFRLASTSIASAATILPSAEISIFRSLFAS